MKKFITYFLVIGFAAVLSKAASADDIVVSGGGMIFGQKPVPV
jgi:hypothetical protein